MNTGLLQYGYRAPASRGLKKMFKVSTSSFHEAWQERNFWDSVFYRA